MRRNRSGPRVVVRRGNGLINFIAAPGLSFVESSVVDTDALVGAGGDKIAKYLRIHKLHWFSDGKAVVSPSPAMQVWEGLYIAQSRSGGIAGTVYSANTWILLNQLSGLVASSTTPAKVLFARTAYHGISSAGADAHPLGENMNWHPRVVRVQRRLGMDEDLIWRMEFSNNTGVNVTFNAAYLAALAYSIVT